MVLQRGHLYSSLSVYKTDSIDTTQSAIKYGDLYMTATCFQCFPCVPRLPLPLLAIKKMSSLYVNYTLMFLSRFTSCLRIRCLSMTATKKNWITYFTTCNKSDARTLFFFLENSPGFAQCAGHEWVSEWKTEWPALYLLTSCPSAPRLMQPFSPGTSDHRPQRSLRRQQWWACRPGQARILQSSRGTLQENSRCGSHGIKLFSDLKPPTYQEGPTDSLLLNGLLWVRPVQEICVSSKFVCNCAITSSFPNPELSRRSSFLSSWIPSWTLMVFAHFHKDFMPSKLMSCRVNSLYIFLSKTSSWRADTSLNFINAKPESLSLGDRCQSKVFHLFECQPCEFRYVLVEPFSWVLQSLDSRLLDRFSTPHFQVLGKSNDLFHIWVCNVLQGTKGLFITLANPSLSDSFWPRIAVHLNSFSVSRLAWVRRLRSGSSLPLKRCLALCVRTNQTKDQVHRELDVNSDCTTISTWEAQNKLALQRDAVGDICTNRTFQLQPEGTRNNVCISRVCMTVSTCTFPIFAGFSTCETFLAFVFVLSRLLWRLTLRMLVLFQSSFLWSCPSTFVVVSCLSLGPTSFLCRRAWFCPRSRWGFDVLLQHHVFNTIFRQVSVVVLAKTVQLPRVERFTFFHLSLLLSLPFWLDSYFSKLRSLSPTIIFHNADVHQFCFLFTYLTLSVFLCFLLVCHSLEHGFH